MEQKTKFQGRQLLVLSIIIPSVALGLAFVLQGVHQSLNLFAASLALVSCLAYSMVLHRGINYILVTMLFTVLLRAILLILVVYLMGYDTTLGLTATGFVVGYHVLETILVSLQSQKVANRFSTKEAI